MTAFEELGVIPELGRAVSEIGWEIPTAIQSDAIPCILGGADVLIAAETGSGKTGAFCLPVVQIVWENRKKALEGSGSKEVKNEWKLNLKDRDAGLAMKEGDLACESKCGRWCGARSTGILQKQGRYYYEAKIVLDGLCRVGWASERSTLEIGTDNLSFGFGGTGKKSYSKKFEDYGTSFTTGDVIGCFLDLDNKTMWWSKNGQEFPEAYRIPPHLVTEGLCPALVLKNSGLELNFGDSPFKFPPRNDFVGVSKATDVKWTKSCQSSQLHPNHPLCIILEPTREMVEQTHNNLVLFAKELDKPKIRCVSATRDIMDALMDGVDIITGTPQRISSLVDTKKLHLDSLQFIVIDEADQFLSNRQTDIVVDKLMKQFPLCALDGTKRQNIVCSATLHKHDVKNFANKFMHFPQWIDLKGTDAVSENVHQVVCYVDASEDKQWIRMMHGTNRLKDDEVHSDDRIKLGTDEPLTLSLGTKILKGVYVLKAIKQCNISHCIIFCRTKQQCDQMNDFLVQNGYTAVCLHGDRSSDDRFMALQQFKDGNVQFLICTDVAARGLDISGVPYVINMTLPVEKEMYVHRIGRVGRAERMGLAISLVSRHKEKVWYHQCKTKGGPCHDTRDKDLPYGQRGCSTWLNEMELLGQIEEHIGQTVTSVDEYFNIPVNEFDGKIVYGQKRHAGTTFEGHASSLATSVAQLADLERSLQTGYLTAVQPVFAKISVL